MDEKLQELIHEVCAGFPTPNVVVCQVFDARRFARMAHFAWKNNLGFHPNMFKEALMDIELFQSLSEDEIEIKAGELCRQADFAKSMFQSAFDLEKPSI